MKSKRNQDYINARSLKLENAGLDVWHQDSSVNLVVDYDDVTLDFSSTSEDKWLVEAIQQAYRLGKEKGANDMQAKLRSLIGIGE
jgi:hypothetical protein